MSLGEELGRLSGALDESCRLKYELGYTRGRKAGLRDAWKPRPIEKIPRGDTVLIFHQSPTQFDKRALVAIGYLTDTNDTVLLTDDCGNQMMLQREDPLLIGWAPIVRPEVGE